jgi:hypothetical protein
MMFGRSANYSPVQRSKGRVRHPGCHECRRSVPGHTPGFRPRFTLPQDCAKHWASAHQTLTNAKTDANTPFLRGKPPSAHQRPLAENCACRAGALNPLSEPPGASILIYRKRLRRRISYPYGLAQRLKSTCRKHLLILRRGVPYRHPIASHGRIPPPSAQRKGERGRVDPAPKFMLACWPRSV